MTSLLRLAFPGYQAPGTIENAGIRPTPAEPVDIAEFDRKLVDLFEGKTSKARSAARSKQQKS